MPIFVRRLLEWTLLCAVCALPSFIWAYHAFRIEGMATGLAVFILAYAVVTSTEWFGRFVKRAFVRRTLVIGYGIRVVCSIIFPVGMFVDLVPGMISVGMVERVCGGGAGDLGVSPVASSFWATFAITLIQGTLLNFILGVLMLIVYGIQRLVCRWPESPQGHCEQCGYDLRASYQFGRCPECGMPCSQEVESPDPDAAKVSVEP